MRRESSAEGAGLNVGDEILAIDSVRVTEDVNKLVAAMKAGSRFKLLVNRGGLLRELPVTLARLPLVAYRLEAIPNQTEKQKTLYARWLVINN